MFNTKTRFHHLYKSGLLLVILTVGGLLLPGLTSTTAFADTPGVTGAVSAGALSETASAASFAGTIGATPTFTIPIQASDLTGSSAGWNLTITSTQLTSGANLIPNSSSNITGVTATCTTANTCSSASVTSTTTYPVLVPSATSAPAAVRFSSFAAASASGIYTVTPTVSVFIPGSTKLGSYTSTYTLLIVSGP